MASTVDIQSSTASTSAEAAPRQPIWLRCEKKPFEHRSALTPTTAKVLLDNNFDVFVERDPQRIFEDSEFEAWVFHSLSFFRKSSIDKIVTFITLDTRVTDIA